MPCAWFSYLVCGVHPPSQLLPMDPLPKHLLYFSPMQCYQVLEGSKGDPTCVQSTIATRYCILNIL